MYLKALGLSDFRGYAEQSVEFDPGVSVLVGPNGQGKTNLVEAVAYLATLSSHRVATDQPLVRAGAERAVVRGEVVHDARSTLLEIEINPGRANRVRINRAPVPRPREMLGLLRTVVFAPEDLALVKGDPDGRRRFLDGLLVARQPRYAGVLADYDRVHKQRNALLRTSAAARRAGPAGDYRTLDVWDVHLARHGAEVLAGRLSLLQALGPLVAKAYDALAPTAGGVELGYRDSLGDEGTSGRGDATRVADADRDTLAAAMLAALARLRPQEIERGVSLAGPHRDDLLISLGALPAKGYASQGESWSLALALKLASFELLRAEGGEPVLMLDDVFAELDLARRSRLAEMVAPAEQVLVTAAVPADVPDTLTGARYDVMAAAVTRVS